MLTKYNLTRDIFYIVILNIFVSICAGNQICEVENEVAVCKEGFPEDEGITKLVLDIKRIEKDDLAKYTNLTILDLSNSELEFIDPQALISNEHLEELNLSGLQALEVPEGIFLSSKSLTHLNLSQTNLKEFQRNAFAELPNLETLDLSETEIKDFSFLNEKKQLHLIISKDTETDIKHLCSEIKINQITEKSSEVTIKCTNEETAETTTEANITEHVKHETEISKNSEKENKENSEPVTAITENIPENLQDLEINKTTEKQPEAKNIIPQIPEATTVPESEPTTLSVENETENSTKVDSDNSENEKTEEESITNITTEVVTDKPENLYDGGIQNPDAEISDKEINSEKSHENIKEPDNVNVDAVKPEPQESKGANIVLGIILCVMICGAIGFGFKYWKNRQGGYRNANTEDVEEGKELQSMGTRQNNEEQNN